MLHRLMRRTGIDGRDILGAAGCISLLYGLASWWVPAAWMVAGLLLLSAALWPYLRKAM
jgi:CHASE2 domain-containing sensor protein